MPASSQLRGPIVIIGAGEHGTCVAEVIVSLGAELGGFVDPDPDADSTLLGYPVTRELDQQHLARGWPIALGVGDNFARERLHVGLVRRGATHTNFPALAHEDSSISAFAELSPGTIVLQGANVGPRTSIGRMCVIATGASVTHDARMEDYSFVATGAVLGASTLGRRSFVGMSSAVHRGVVIGPDVVVGALSFVRDDLPAETVAFGVPATIRRPRAIGEPYLTRSLSQTAPRSRAVTASPGPGPSRTCSPGSR